MKPSMKKTRWLISAICLVGVLLAGTGTFAGEDEQDVALTLEQITNHAKITLAEAVALALDEHAGRAVEADFEGEVQGGQTVYFYEVKILDAGGVFYEVSIDSIDGHVIGGKVDNEKDEAAERQNLTQAAAAARIDLTACIKKAAAEGKGQVFAAAMEMDDGKPRCEAVSAGSKRYYEIEVSLLDGDVLEVESTRHYGEENEDNEANEANEASD